MNLREPPTTGRAVLDTEERYRAFLANSSEGIWCYELDEPLDLTAPADTQLEHIYRHARLVELNDVMARMYGYERADELRGAALDKTLPRSDPAAEAYLRGLIAAGFVVRDAESAERDREGRVRYFANTMIPIVESGRLWRAWGVQRDITDQKCTEQENHRLVEELRSASRHKDEFLTLLAHELRNPLAPLRNALQVARMRSGADVELRRAVELMERQVGQLQHLIDDLLDVGRIAKGKLALHREPTLLSDVLARAVEGAQAAFEAHRHRFSLQLRDGGAIVDGDPRRLEQVFSNLLSNSAKYTEAGGTIILSVDREGHEVLVTVRDDGVGIPEHALESVFNMFAQVHAHRDRGEGGLGIGLALVRQIVELHGGTVSVSSEGPGKGSTFTVRLRIAALGVDSATAQHGEPREDATGAATRERGASPRTRGGDPSAVDELREAIAAYNKQLKQLGTSSDDVRGV